MARNIEIKARLNSPESQERAVVQRADQGPELLKQRDVFFQAPQGRLKLRYLSDTLGQLISYDRPNQEGPKTSTYQIYTTDQPQSLEETLRAALPVIGVVAKQRLVYMVGQTRVHLDRVEGLPGIYLELEVVLQQDQSQGEGETIAADLIDAFHVEDQDLIQGAYLDMLAAR